MTRAALLAACLASLASGCSLIFKPDRDAIVPDRDAGPDGGRDAGLDAGDGGPPDGGESCVPTREVCDDAAEADEDCDGTSNCLDFDCRGAATCCRPGSTSTPHCLASLGEFVRLPASHESDIVFSDSLCTPGSRVTEFGPTGRTRALVTTRCQPVTFGMTLAVTFEIMAGCAGTCDYAALSFGPVRTLADGAPFPSELRVVVRADGSAAVDRAGTPIGEAWPPGTLRTRELIEVQVSLEPGYDESQQDVLFATVDLVVDGTGDRILTRTPVAPLDALECIEPGGGPPGIGLNAAVEGAGTNVEVVGPLSILERQCSNPSQFYAGAERVDLSQIEACEAGGVGAPALVGYCRANCTSPAASVQWDLWVDSSRTPRSEETFRFVDFGICGFGWQSPFLPETPSWIARPQSPFLIGDSDSSREPTLLPISDDGASTRVLDLLYAYAQRVSDGQERYAIHGGVIDSQLNRSPMPFDDPVLLRPEDAGCVSVRDPLLLARYASATVGHRVSGAWLLFTCEHAGPARDTIGIAAFTLADGAHELRYVEGSIDDDLVTPVDGTYSERGVFAPEGFTEIDGDVLKVRLWYLARDGMGRVRLAYAQGHTRDLDAFPSLEPYPGNPILAGDSRVLGECPTSCALTGASVTPSLGPESQWQFVISRSRLTSTGAIHELVTLLQPAPND